MLKYPVNAMVVFVSMTGIEMSDEGAEESEILAAPRAAKAIVFVPSFIVAQIVVPRVVLSPTFDVEGAGSAITSTALEMLDDG